jgi:hypothetical protein
MIISSSTAHFPTIKQRHAFQIGIKENKTPGGEHCLDLPGAELLAWL